MKKLYYLILAMLPLVFFTACHDDDDNLPDVDINVYMSGALQADGNLYVVQGDTLSVDSITVTPLNGTKAATLGNPTIFWDTFRVGTVVSENFSFKFNTADMPVGNHFLGIRMGVYQVDKTLAFAVLGYKVVLVESADQIPAGATPVSVKPDDIKFEGGE